MAIIFIFCVGCLILAFLGYSTTRKLQDKKGYYYIGGPNGGGANRFLNNHPNARKVYEIVDNHGLKTWDEEELDALFLAGAKAVAFDTMLNGMLVITNEMALAYGKPSHKDVSSGTKGQIFAATHKNEFLSHVKYRELTMPITRNTPVKPKSVIGQAVAGSVVAGGVGAVVGALNAYNSNLQNNGKVETRYVGEIETGLHVSEFSFHFATNKLILNSIYLSPELRDGYDDVVVSTRICSVCNQLWK